MECPVCGDIIPDNSSRCMVCGYYFSPQVVEPQVREPQIFKKPSKKCPWRVSTTSEKSVVFGKEIFSKNTEFGDCLEEGCVAYRNGVCSRLGNSNRSE